MLMNVDKPQNLYRMRNLQFQPSTTCIKMLPLQNQEPVLAHPCQALRLSKKWLDGPLQNEEPATNLGVFSTKSGHPTPCFLVHSYDFQKHWPLQSGEPGMSKHLSRIATWKKENRQKYKGPFYRGMMWKNLVSPSHLKTLKCTKIHFVEAIPVPHFQIL